MSENKENTLAFITHSPESYPLKDPQIDEMQVARRKRRRTSPRELTMLEAEFRKCSKPCKQDREDIANRVGMSEKAVQIWFQNKRQSARKQRQRPMTPSTPLHPITPSNLEDATPTPCRMRPSLPIFNTPMETPKPPEAKRLRLTMSEDGKAQVVVRSPLAALDKNIAKRHQSLSAPAARAASLPSIRDLENRENECVSNLLFLRSGKW